MVNRLFDGIVSFTQQSYLTYRGLFGWLNWQGYISNVLLRPVVVVLTFSLIGRFAVGLGVAQRFALGMAVLGMFFIAMNGIAQSYFFDRQTGTIKYLFITRGNRISNYLSRGICHLPNAILAFITGIFTAWLVVYINFEWFNWGYLILVVMVIAISMTMFGQFIGVLVLITNNWVHIAGLTNSIMMVLTGVIIPIGRFPGPLYEFAKLLPMTNGLLVLGFLFDGAEFSQLYGLLLRELITGFTYLILGYLGFIYFERHVRQTGELH